MMALVKSINYWSYPGGLDASLPIETFLQWAKEDGFEGVELAISDGGILSLEVTEKQCLEWAKMAADLGLKTLSVASGIYWSYSLASPQAIDRVKAKEALKRMIHISSWLGAKTLLTIPGAVDIFFMPNREVQSYDDVLNLALEGLHAVLPNAKDHEVRLGIENVWNRFLLSPTEMAEFIDAFDSPFIGAYLDVANVLPFGYPEQWLKILRNRIVGIHFKDYRRAVGTGEGFVDLLEGDVNWPEVMKAIDLIQYHGPVVAEMIPAYKHYPRVRVQNASHAMNAILKR